MRGEPTESKKNTYTQHTVLFTKTCGPKMQNSYTKFWMVTEFTI